MSAEVLVKIRAMRAGWQSKTVGEVCDVVNPKTGVATGLEAMRSFYADRLRHTLRARAAGAAAA